MPKNTNQMITETIGKRVKVGLDPLVSGWQNFIVKLLSSMKPYLVDGSLVTFEKLLSEEKVFFEKLVLQAKLSDGLVALFIPPSVRHQMMFNNEVKSKTEYRAFDPALTSDDGSVLISRSEDFNTVMNVLFAHPPCTPAVDVYENGKLIAGYTYHTIEACVKELSSLVQVHFSSQT